VADSATVVEVAVLVALTKDRADERDDGANEVNGSERAGRGEDGAATRCDARGGERRRTAE